MIETVPSIVRVVRSHAVRRPDACCTSRRPGSDGVPVTVMATTADASGEYKRWQDQGVASSVVQGAGSPADGRSGAGSVQGAVMGIGADASAGAFVGALSGASAAAWCV